MLSATGPAPPALSASLVPPVRPEFEPSLPHLLAPWWRRLDPRQRRVLAVVIVVVLVAVALAIAVAARPHRFTHSGPVAFSFTYPGALHRVAASPGEYVKLERHSHGKLIESVSIKPLELPPYQGRPQSELPIYAAGYTQLLARTVPGFVPLGDGEGKASNTSAYYVYYQLGISSNPLYGRDYLLVRDRSGARSGVIVVLRATQAAGVNLVTPVGTSGDTFSVLAGFHFG